MHLMISKNAFMDILKSIYGYPKIDFWISIIHFGYPKMNYGYPKIIKDIHNSFLDIQK